MQPQLFKEENNADDFKKYVPVNVNTSFRTLAPYLGLAELNYIKPLLGDELFEELLKFYSDNTQKAEVKKWHQLLDYVKYSEIHLAFYLGWSVLSTSISDSGAESKAAGDKRLFRYQEVEVVESFKNNGFNILDTALNFLYENIKEFEKFKKSNFYKENQQTLVPTTAIFNAIYNINNSRLVFLKMRQYIKIVEDIELLHHFGREFIDELLAAKLEDAKYCFVAEKIRYYIVYLSVAKGIGELKKLPTEKGLIFEYISDRASREGYVQNQIDVKEVETTMQFCKSTAEAYLSSAIDYLKKHKENFPTFIKWTGSNCPQNTVIQRDNSNKKTFFLPVKI